MDITTLSEADHTSTPRDTTFSFNLNNNVDISDIDMSATMDDLHSTRKKSSIATKENKSDIDMFTNHATISLDETEVNGASEIEKDLEQSSMVDITDHNNCTEPLNEGAIIVENGQFFQKALIELGRRLWKSTAEKQHYTKGCIWSPDGLCILVPVHLDGMHVIELPSDLYADCAGQTVTATRNLSKLDTAVHVKEGGTVYDYAWYPFMNSQTPATCCWLASRQHEPIHMWDAFTGELRCTYRGYDSVDEVESAIAVTFSNDGEKVIGGYKKSIKVFDTNVPGRDLNSIGVKQAVSCFAFTTDNDSTITTGSWNGYINHFDLRAPKLGPLFTLGGHTGGITWLRYAQNSDYWSLFSGARKDNKILEWDMRNYTQPVREFIRNVATNQRIYFDLSPLEQRWLVSGDTTGYLRVWDLQHNIEEALPLHGDCCNGVSFHPSLPILATTSGQHHFVSPSQDEDASFCEQNTTPEGPIVDYENALMMWWIGESATDCEASD